MSGADRVTRRALLTRAAVAVASLGGATLVWRVAQQSVLAPGTGAAYAAWNARLVGDGPLSLIRAAVLAANAHDTQPWLFRADERRIDLLADRTRTIGSVDPLHRELELSLGCAIENLALAARANGFVPTVRLRPDARDADHVASIDLAEGTAATSELFAAIPRRHTDRTAFAGRPVARATLEEMERLSDDPRARLMWLDTDPAKRRFGDLTIEATAALIADPDQSRHDFAWYRQDWDEIHAKKDGITLDAAGLDEPLRIVARTLPPAGRATLQQGWLDATRERHVPTAAAFGMILVRDPLDTVQRLIAGRLLQRALLFAASQGLATQPLNQVFERADREATAHLPRTFTDALGELTPSGWSALTAFRIGHPTAGPRLAPRRLAEEVMR